MEQLNETTSTSSFNSQEEQKEPLTNIEMFYKESLKETNVVDVQYFKEQLLQIPTFDWEEFNKPINELDMVKVFKSVESFDFKTEWKQPAPPQTAAGKKPVKSSILKYTLNKGSLFGIGSGKKEKVLILKGLRSKFSTHGFAFGDDKQKSYLFEQLEDVLQQRKTIDYKEFKKIAQASLQFEMYSESNQCQNPEVIEQLKYLLLLKYVVGDQVSKQQDPQHSIPEHKVNGFIQTKYDNHIAEDLTKLTVNMNIISPYENNANDKVDIICIENPHDQYKSSYEVKYMDEDCKTINDYLNMIKMKEMDIVVAIDSCSTKKQGRELILMPKLKVLQIILRGGTKKSQKHIGLRLLRNV